MKFSIRPLTALAIVLSSLGVVEAGRLALDATNAFAATEAAAPVAATAAPSQEAPTDVASDTPPPTCLPVDLAKEAGISAAEFRLLQSLQDRRQTLDGRERDIITREGIIKTADDVVRSRIGALHLVEANIQRLLGQVDEVEAQRLGALVRVYEKMKPKDAAKVLEGLDDEVVLGIASKMKDAPLALILAKMEPARAREITMLLAQIDENRAFAPPSEPAPPTQARPNTPPRNQSANNSPQPKGQAAAQGAAPTSPAAPSAPAPTAGAGSAPKAGSGQAPADPSGRPNDLKNKQ